jgi:hypothetical protein
VVKNGASFTLSASTKAGGFRHLFLLVPATTLSSLWVSHRLHHRSLPLTHTAALVHRVDVVQRILIVFTCPSGKTSKAPLLKMAGTLYVYRDASSNR